MRASWTPLRAWVWAFLLLGGLAATWAVANPPLANPDEPAHSVKGAALWRGQVLPPKLPLPDEGPGSFLRGAFTTLVTVPHSYSFQTSEAPTCFIFDSTIAADCMPAWRDDPRPTPWTSYIGRYPPTYYAAVGWTTRVDTGVAGFYAMRLASAAVGAALLAAAIALACLTPRLRLVPLGVVLAATPEALQLLGSINPNGFEIAAATLAWVSLCTAALWDGPALPRQVLVAGVVSCAALAWTRPLSDLWLALIALTALALFGAPARVRAHLARRDTRLAVGLVGVAAVTAALWTVLSDDLGNNRGYDPWGLGYLQAAQHSLALTWSYLQQMVGVFGWDRTPAPAPLTWVWGLALAVLVGAALARADRRRRAVLAALVAVVLLVPTVLQAPTAPRFGFVWSGRYGLAAAAGIPIAAALVLGERGWSRRWGAGLAATAGAGQVVAHAAALRRWTVGTDGPLNYLADPRWEPPVAPWALLVATVALAAGLAVLVHRIGFSGDDPGAESRVAAAT